MGRSGQQLLLLRAVLALGLVCLSTVHAADPDPVKDFELGIYSSSSSSSLDAPEATINSITQSFTYRNLEKKGDVSYGPGGRRAALSPKFFPAMSGQGITVVRFRMVPCGTNLPHTHPRASEMLTLLSGGPLQVGFVDTHGVVHMDILHPGDVTIFPRGMLHFELNVGTKIAHFLSALNSENPGTLSAAGALFQLPDRALATALNVSLEQLKTLRETLYPYNGPSLQKNDKSRCIAGKDVTLEF